MSNRVNKTTIVCHTSFGYMLRIKGSFSWWLAHRHVQPIQQGSRYGFTVTYITRYINKCCISRRAGLSTLNILLYKDKLLLQLLRVLVWKVHSALEVAWLLLCPFNSSCNSPIMKLYWIIFPIICCTKQYYYYVVVHSFIHRYLYLFIWLAKYPKDASRWSMVDVVL